MLASTRGSSFSSPPHYSGHAEPRRSATWWMINAAGCRAKSSPSGGAVVPIWGRACRHRSGPGGPLCGGVAKGGALGSGVGGGGQGRGTGSWRDCHHHPSWGNTPASPPAGRRESRPGPAPVRRMARQTSVSCGRDKGCHSPACHRRPISTVVARGSISLSHGMAPEGAWWGG